MPVLLHSKTPVSRGNVRCSLCAARIDKGTLDARVLASLSRKDATQSALVDAVRAEVAA